MGKKTKQDWEVRHREMWMQLFAEGLDKYTGETTKAEVLNGHDKLSVKSTSAEVSEWIRGAMERLDALVEDKETRRCVMLCCSNRFPVDRIKLLREEYDRTGDVDKLLEYMHKDDSWHGLSYSEYPERDGNVIYVTKIPYDPKSFDSTNDLAEKRASYCHCPHIRPAVRDQKAISATFCLCGSGWYKTLWEGLLNQPVHVEVLDTIARGADKCRFAIHLPEKYK